MEKGKIVAYKRLFVAPVFRLSEFDLPNAIVIFPASSVSLHAGGREIKGFVCCKPALHLHLHLQIVAGLGHDKSLLLILGTKRSLSSNELQCFEWSRCLVYNTSSIADADSKHSRSDEAWTTRSPHAAVKLTLGLQLRLIKSRP